MFDIQKTRMIGLTVLRRNYYNMLSRFHRNTGSPERNGRTGGHIVRQYAHVR